MAKEKYLLENMLNNQKISNDEYKLLTNALATKSSLDSLSSLLINPFQKLAGFQALLVGLIIIIASSSLAVVTKIYFDGVASCTIASSFKNAKIQPNFIFLLYQSLVSWLMLAFLYLLMAKIFKQKRIRIIDIFSTTALARLPYLVLTAILSIAILLKPGLYDFDPAKDFKFEPSLFLAILDLVWQLSYAWLLATNFYALRESTGLSGKRLWLSFLISIMVGQIASMYLCRMFL